MKIKVFAGLALACGIAAGCVAVGYDAPKAQAQEDGWVSLFDGKTLNGWKVTTENPNSFRVEDGNIVANGNRAHLYYVGDDKPFVNFEFKAEIMTLPSSNSGVYIHTQYQDTGWPHFGYECQVNQTHGDRIKTGSLYNVVDVYKVDVPEGQTYSPSVTVDKGRVLLNVPEAPAKDNEWFTYHIIVNGKRIITEVNGKKLVDYTEPDGKVAGKDFTRVLDKGTFALQAHDPGSKTMYRSIMVKRLP
jgi:hypothetical protein